MAQLRLDREAVIAAGKRVLPILDSVFMRFTAIEDRQIIPNELFPWTKDLEDGWGPIRDEARQFLRDTSSIPSVRELSPDHHKIAVDDKWRSYFLWAYGLRVDDNCARCPETARLLDRIPGLLTAFYSVMLAGAHVPRHTGPTKAILTAHLGLIVPENREQCRMQIGEQDVIWQEGRLVIFDDMNPHEVWNSTNEDRAVLLLHVKRPLRFPGSLLQNLFFAALRKSPFVQDGLRNLDRWQKNELKH
ncbi:MAG: aspartyl/asparaginyl beta-hydroxylase domain-containing protein [Proteobacteria bacterium]|nr:aspartyl/asparaginyl beta-hydroxylase domain-containing protein [Pseudomonadota bacterium]